MFWKAPSGLSSLALCAQAGGVNAALWRKGTTIGRDILNSIQKFAKTLQDRSGAPRRGGPWKRSVAYVTPLA
jgi:hypothetical protein